MPELRALLKLAYPIVIAQVGMVTMGVVDTLIVGPMGPEQMSALALGNTLYFGLLISGIGLMMSLDAYVSQAYGAGDLDRCAKGRIQALWIALAFTPILFAAMTAIPWLLGALGYDPLMVDLAGEYLFPMRWGILPALAFVAYRSFMSAVDVTRPLLVSALLGNVVNAALDLWLIDGGLGVPALGVLGVAWSTAACRVVLLLPLWLVVTFRKDFRHFGRPSWAPDLATIRQLLVVGLPVGLQYSAEVLTFSAAALMMGVLGPVALAAHQVSLNVIALLFMAPLGLGAAGAVRTGQALGRDDIDGVARAGWTAIQVGTVYALACAALLFALPGPIAAAYRLDPPVQALAIELLFIAVFFQLGDAVQAVTTGVLRGIGDTRTPFLLVLCSHVLITIPIGILLGVIRYESPHWVWYGLGVGLCLLGLFLVLRFRWKVGALRAASAT